MVVATGEVGDGGEGGDGEQGGLDEVVGVKPRMPSMLCGCGG